MVRRKTNSASSPNIFGAIRDVLIASMNKGQFPLAIFILLFGFMIWRMPKEDVSRLVFHIFDILESGALIGYILAPIICLGWYIHAKWQRRTLSLEIDRIAEERNFYQAQLSGAPIESSEGRKPRKQRQGDKTMMSGFFLTLAVIALFHFLYEGVIAPSLRLKLRFQLFALRDDLRRLTISNQQEISQEVFRLLQSMINNAITLLHRVNLEVIMRAERALEHDKVLLQKTEQRIEILDDCPNEEVRKIRSQTYRIVAYALLINNGAWFIYLIPIAIMLAGAQRIKSFVKEAVFLPETELERIAPANRPIHA